VSSIKFYTFLCKLQHMYIHVYACAIQAMKLYMDCYLETYARKVVDCCGRKEHIYAYATAQTATP